MGSAPDPALRQPVAPERRESRNALAIRVSAKVEGSPQLPLAGDEPAVGQVAGQGRVSDRPVEPRARARADAPVPQPIEPAQPDPGARPANAGAVSQPPALTSPDVAAVLDRLVAAREALKPAEAAFEIYHEEFGEVSIRIEQTQRGHLSVELAASDPELKRAVAAAVHADGAATSHADSGTSRSGGQQREGLMDRGGGAGSEPRSQGEPGTRNRREPARPDSDSARPDRHSGTFA